MTSIQKKQKECVVSYLSKYFKKIQLSPSDFEINTGLSKSYFYAIRNKTIDSIPRKKLLCICIGLNFTKEKTDKLLIIAGYTTSDYYYLRDAELRIFAKLASGDINKQQACHEVRLLYCF